MIGRSFILSINYGKVRVIMPKGWSKGLTKETDDRVARRAESHEGIPLSKEHRQSLSLSLTGKPKSEEHNRKNSLSHQGQITWIKGKTKEEYPQLAQSAKTRDQIEHTLVRRFALGELEPWDKGLTKKTHSGLASMAEKRLSRVYPKKDTSIEVKLQKGLDRIDVSFERHKSILGQPDIFIEPNICVFADGNYWHNYPEGRGKDQEIMNILQWQGYRVLRFWEHEINENLEDCLDKIQREMKFS